MPRTSVSRLGLALLLTLLIGVCRQAAQAEAPDEVPGAITVGVSEAKALYDEGAVFVDVRNRLNYDSGHVKKAVSLTFPTEFTEAALRKVAPLDKAIVLYCNGSHCGMSADAALAAVGFGYTKVYYFRDGYPVWQSGGMPVN